VTWLDAGPLAAIPLRGARVLRTADGPIAVFRTGAGRVFALRDRCPHRGGPLSQGIVHGDCVTCPLHDWIVELGSGAARAPDQGVVETFAVRVDGERVLIELLSESTLAEAPRLRAQRR
jgi:nitrite reductase (NADH) small subunit